MLSLARAPVLLLFLQMDEVFDLDDALRVVDFEKGIQILLQLALALCQFLFVGVPEEVLFCFYRSYLAASAV